MARSLENRFWGRPGRHFGKALCAMLPACCPLAARAETVKIAPIVTFAVAAPLRAPLLRSMPLRLKAEPLPARAQPLLALAGTGPDLADRLGGLLAIRDDLRFMVNEGVENAANQRIRLGLRFGTRF